MRGPQVQFASFPTARCSSCEKVVLTYVAVEDDGSELRRCVDCDGAIKERLEWIGADDLEELGYHLGPPGAKPGGCGGGGCGSCSR